MWIRSDNNGVLGLLYALADSSRELVLVRNKGFADDTAKEFNEGMKGKIRPYVLATIKEDDAEKFYDTIFTRQLQKGARKASGDYEAD